LKLDYIYPLIGVLLGWLLSEISQLFKGRRKNKRIVRRSIFLLIEIRLHLSFINPILQTLLSTQVLNKNFVDILNDIFKRKNFSPDTFEQLSSETTLHLSHIDPDLAIHFKHLITNSNLILDKGFISQHLEPLNKQGIKLIFEGNNLTIKEMNSLISKLSFHYNIFFWLKHKIKLLKKNINNPWPNLFSKFNK
jgi:hypothetical protein